MKRRNKLTFCKANNPFLTPYEDGQPRNDLVTLSYVL